LNVAAIGVVTLSLGYFLSVNLKTTFESEIEEQVSKSASLAKKYMRQNGILDPMELAKDLSTSLRARVTIVGRDGRVLGDSDLSPEGVASVENHADRPEVIQAIREGNGAAIRWSSTLRVPFIYVATILDNGDVLRIATPLSTAEKVTNRLRGELVLAMLVSVGMTFVFGYMVYDFVSKPLRRVADASRELALGNLMCELPLVGDRDLAVVASSLNGMARSLQKKMEESQDDKRRTEAIITGMSAGVVVFDREVRAILTNRSLGELLETYGQAAGKSPMELVRQPSLDAVVRNALKGADTPAVELKTSNGKTLLAKTVPVRSLSGQVDRVVVVFHDLTEIRRTEKMRKDFIANVSHEFKTPLTSIRGFTETLLTSLPKDPNVTREFLEAIGRNSTLLQALVDDLLVLARLESETAIDKHEFDVFELIEQQIQSRQHLLREKDVRVEVECPRLEILADRQRLSRAVSNLLDNAIYYNREHGSVRITGRSYQGGFQLNVADTGFGIRKEDLSRIFERFYRVEKSRARDSGGTGLGLAIAKHAIESQGGTISVSSTPGAGSTFAIFLPNALHYGERMDETTG